MKYPLFAIIYNWKGLKEENYLYTEDELKQFDKELYEDCIENPDEWHDSQKADCAWKTWQGKFIESENELQLFLNGYYNDEPDGDEDWYWENIEDNDLYGYPSDTMKEVLTELNMEV